jgi:hypothetical protein
VLANNSLRFRASASAYLDRTFPSAGNRKTYTLSLWVKRGILGGSANQFFFSSGVSTTAGGFYFTPTDQIEVNPRVNNTNTFLTTTQVFRDPSAWYHIVFSLDTTQATDSNRMKLYVNGVQVTAFSTAVYPAFDGVSTLNNNIAHWIGRYPEPGFPSPFDGYLAEYNFIDGQALTPNSFGSFNGLGVWQPIRYGGSYGTNGFYLPFTNTTSTTTLGYDFSPQGNNWTTNNISLTAGSTYDSMTDVPTLTSATAANYCTLNPTLPIPRGTISQGNLNYLSGSTSLHGSAGATFTLPTTGKWYWEVTACANSGGSGNNETIGVANILNNPQLPASGSEIGGGSRGDYGYRSDGNKYNNGNQGAYGATYTNSDVIGVAWDSDAGTLVFYKNGSSQGTAFSSIAQVADKFVPASSNAESSNGDSYNFGQRPFAYTPPTGFNRLNTFNLPTPTIGATASTTANKYFDALLYTGNGSASQRTDISWANMQPDMVWIKNRTSANNHVLHDDVRGTAAALQPNLTNATDSPVGFGADGFGFDGVANQLRIFTSDGRYNTNGNAYVTWGWKGSGAAGVTNTAGSITSTVSANASAGFSIATFTSPSSGTASFGHGLGVTPSFVIVKSRASGNWICQHTSTGTQYLLLNGTGAATTDSTVWNSAPTSSIVNIGTGFAGTINYVAYCFAQVAGYSAFGSYTGNGSADGTFVYTGFRPRWIMVKPTNVSGEYWQIIDTSRNPYNASPANMLSANLADAEANIASQTTDILSNGFKFRGTGGGTNGSGTTYIYAAFAETPLKFSNAR